MSIIYDALQKTQKTRDAQAQAAEGPASNATAHRMVRLDIVLMAIIVVMLIVEIIMHYPRSHQAVQPPHVAKAAPVVQPQPQAQTQPPLDAALNTALEDYRDNHTVNGVFMSEKDKLALIDSKPYHVGDDVDGMTIVAINMNSVKLRNLDRTVVLKAQA